MQTIRDPAVALAVLQDPAFAVPPLPPADGGIGWLRSAVARFSTGPDHARRRALSKGLLDAVPVAVLRAPSTADPVERLAGALGVPGLLTGTVAGLVRDVAQAYQPRTGDDARASAAVDRLVAVLGGTRDEVTAARTGLLVQACVPTATLVERARRRPVADVLRDDPPVPLTRRQALTRTEVAGLRIAAGEVVAVGLAGGLAFGAGPRRCPGEAYALALVEGALG